MRTRIFRALLILGLVAGVAAPTSAGAIDTPTPTPTPTATPTATARGWCVKVGTGELRNLWLTPSGRCPIYTPKTDEYWGPTTLGGGTGTPGPAGPAGPAGPKGDPGDSAIKVISKQVTLTSSSPATQTVVLTGLPAKASGVVELPVDNSGSAPAGTTVTVTPLAVPAGSTERSFTVGVSGFTTQTFTLAIKVLAVSA